MLCFERIVTDCHVTNYVHFPTEKYIARCDVISISAAQDQAMGNSTYTTSRQTIHSNDNQTVTKIPFRYTTDAELKQITKTNTHRTGNKIQPPHTTRTTATSLIQHTKPNIITVEQNLEVTDASRNMLL